MASSILERIRTRTKVLPEGLREHLFRVEEVATELAMLHGVEVERARVAALAHDLARAITGEELLLRAQQLGLAIHPVEERVPILLHGSDMVRAWACLMLTSDKTLSLSDRLQATHQFASDRSVAVRECAWDSFRPYLLADLSHSFNLLESWVRSPDPDIRRCAVEATRPRGGWTTHIEALTQDPEPGLRLLELVRSDPSRYVQRSVGNWLNDASKTRPDRVRVVCTRWTSESPSKETHWIVNWALRTPRKNEVR